MLKKNHLQFLAKIYKRYDGIVDAYKVDIIDPYFFWQFNAKRKNSPI